MCSLLLPLAFTPYTLHSTPSNLLRVHDGFISHLHYVITMRSVCDNYVIQTTSMEHMQTRITSTASATTPITYNFYLRKLRFLRKVRKSMSFKMSLNSHNSLFAHIFFNSHFIRYQRLKEQSASSYGLPVNTFQPSSKSPQKLISRCFIPENQYSILNYSAWRK